MEIKKPSNRGGARPGAGRPRKRPPIDEARDRLTQLSVSLGRVFSPMSAAGLLIGAAYGLLAGEIGREKAAAYFAEFAASLTDDEDDENEPPETERLMQ